MRERQRKERKESDNYERGKERVWDFKESREGVKCMHMGMRHSAKVVTGKKRVHTWFFPEPFQFLAGNWF